MIHTDCPQQHKNGQPDDQAENGLDTEVTVDTVGYPLKPPDGGFRLLKIGMQFDRKTGCFQKNKNDGQKDHETVCRTPLNPVSRFRATRMALPGLK